MPLPRPLAISQKVYTALLRLYPAHFRRDYGQAMAQTFMDCCRETYQQRGSSGLARLWLFALVDLLVRAAAEHVDEWMHQGGLTMLRRLMDSMISLLALWLGLPLLLVFGLLIKLESPGPVFFTQQRVGKDGKLFTLVKLRSMTAGDQPRRVTHIGRFLRWSRFDEWPQFWNVVKGDMSIIGPRAPLPDALHSDESDAHERFARRPGLLPVRGV